MRTIQPHYGRRLLPQILDELAQATPSRLYAAISKSADLNDGFKDVTVADMAGAENFMAYWFQQHLVATQVFETLSYINLPDLRYPVCFLAAVKCRYKVCHLIALLNSRQFESWTKIYADTFTISQEPSSRELLFTSTDRLFNPSIFV